jgi:putative aldouronate transport system permease protein
VEKAAVIRKTQARAGASAGDRVFDACNLAWWIFVLFVMIYPLWLIIADSFSDPDAVLAGRVVLLPQGFTLTGYAGIFQSSQLIRAYLNSILYTVCGTFLSVMVTMMGAYGLSRNFAGKRAVNFMVIFTMFFSGGLIPSYLVNRSLGLYNNPAVMVVLGVVSVWNLMITRTYITSNIPNELYDAAIMDGAGHFTFFFRVVLPLSGTIIAVLCVYCAVARWNDYFTALVYISSRKLLPLQTILRDIVASLNSSAASLIEDADKMDAMDVVSATKKAELAKYCSIVVSTVPAVVLYACMQKYFVKGVMVGSLKG